MPKRPEPSSPNAPDSANSSAPDARIVRCPQCGGDSRWSPDNPYRPFCSQRCKLIDLGAWASETYRIPAQAPADDLEAEGGADGNGGNGQGGGG